MSDRAIAEGLFTWPAADPALIGGRCQACRQLSFPVGTACPRCGAAPLAREPLVRSGTLWTWTSQGFPPKAPFNGNLGGAGITPWYVGLVQLGDELRVESLLVDLDDRVPEFDMPVELVVVPFRTEESGDTTVTYAFRPTAPANRSEQESVGSRD